MTLQERMEKQGFIVRPLSTKGFFVDMEHGSLFCKKVDDQELKNSQFIVLREIPGVDFLSICQMIIYDGQTYCIYKIKNNLKNADFSCLYKLINLYIYNDFILPLHQKFCDVTYYLKELPNLVSSHYIKNDLMFVVENFSENIKFLCSSEYLDKAKTGFFHGDLHYGNILFDDHCSYLLDFEETKMSYSVMNLTMPFYLEAFHKIDKPDASSMRNAFMAVCDYPDAVNFDYFFMLTVLYWNLRIVPVIEPDIDQRSSLLRVMLDEDLNKYRDFL